MKFSSSGLILGFFSTLDSSTQHILTPGHSRRSAQVIVGLIALFGGKMHHQWMRRESQSLLNELLSVGSNHDQKSNFWVSSSRVQTCFSFTAVVVSVSQSKDFLAKFSSFCLWLWCGAAAPVATDHYLRLIITLNTLFGPGVPQQLEPLPLRTAYDPLLSSRITQSIQLLLDDDVGKWFVLLPNTKRAFVCCSNLAE